MDTPTNDYKPEKLDGLTVLAVVSKAIAEWNQAIDNGNLPVEMVGRDNGSSASIVKLGPDYMILLSWCTVKSTGKIHYRERD